MIKWHKYGKKLINNNVKEYDALTSVRHGTHFVA